jgi:hypothetical protein
MKPTLRDPGPKSSGHALTKWQLAFLRQGRDA